jgi:hypothetical protein
VPYSLLRRTGVLAIAGCLSVLASGWGAPSASALGSQVKPVGMTNPRPLPAVVNGVPLLALARHALGAAKGYSVSKPIHVQAVVSTQADLYKQVSITGGSGSKEYVVVLQGRFNCGYCGTAAAVPTTTIDPATIPTSTMVLQVPDPIVAGTIGLYVGVRNPDLTRLGRVYDLDPYIKSLKGVSVPMGPLPG